MPALFLHGHPEGGGGGQRNITLFGKFLCMEHSTGVPYECIHHKGT